MQDRASAWDAAPPKHREPDAEILEHERKRKVEVKCLELQLKLEDEGYVQLRSSRHMVDQLIAVIESRKTRLRSRSTSFARSSLRRRTLLYKTLRLSSPRTRTGLLRPRRRSSAKWPGL